MDTDTAPKKRHQEGDSPCKKKDVAAECETICREMLKCTHIDAKPAAQNTAPVKPKKERELLEGYTEYIIFWN